MNDFTKEELIKIKAAVEYSYKELQPFDSYLLKKLQYMIENYQDLKAPTVADYE